MPELSDWVRLAAYIDGEGCIQITRLKMRSGGTPPHLLLVSVSNTDWRLPKWCKTNFGGNLFLPKNKTGYQKKQVAVWQVSGRKAEEVVRQCLPHFIIKREQAEIAIAFRATFGLGDYRGYGKRTPSEIVSKRDWLMRELSRLKHELPDAAIAAIPTEGPIQ